MMRRAALTSCIATPYWWTANASVSGEPSSREQRHPGRPGRCPEPSPVRIGCEPFAPRCAAHDPLGHLGELAAHARAHRVAPLRSAFAGRQPGPLAGDPSRSSATAARWACRSAMPSDLAACLAAVRTNIARSSGCRGRRLAARPTPAPLENENEPTGSIESPNWSSRMALVVDPGASIPVLSHVVICDWWPADLGGAEQPTGLVGREIRDDRCGRYELVADALEGMRLHDRGHDRVVDGQGHIHATVPLTTAGQCWLPMA